MQEQPLKNVKVIDCSTLFAGPMAAMYMGDFGAEVIKVEHPEYGDALREYGQFEEELTWKWLSRNKKSVPVDLHDEEGQEIFKELVQDTDVLIENFRPGTLESWNLGWDTLSEVNPGLVMARVTGFGQSGPYKEKPGFGTLAEAMSGFAHITGQADGPPTLPSFGLADSVSALHSTFAIMFALYWRDVEGGAGQYIDTSILEPMISILGEKIVDYGVKGVVAERSGNSLEHTAPRNTYKTADDEWVALSASSRNIVRRVLRIVGGEELANDPRFKTMESRLEHREELDDLIQDWMSEHTRDEALEKFEEHEAALAPVYDVADLFDDPHIRNRDAIIEVEDDEFDKIGMTGVVPKLSRTPGQIDHSGPTLGEHTEEVLTEETSLSDGEIAGLCRRGVLARDDE